MTRDRLIFGSGEGERSVPARQLAAAGFTA